MKRMVCRVILLLSAVCMWGQGQHLDYDIWAEQASLSGGLCRYGNSVQCCWGWRQTDRGRCQPHCQQSCKHGECVGPNRCKCHPGYAGKACNQDLNECGVKPRPCKHRCMNTQGSYKCYCLDGYTAQPDGSCRNARTCYHANCQYGCEVIKGAVRCTCPSPGLRLGPDRRTCVDIDECMLGGVCPRRRKCVNTFGSFVCKCHLGFKLTYINGRYTCIDKDTRPFCSLNPASPKCRCKNSGCTAVLKVTVQPQTPRTSTPTTTTTTTTTKTPTTTTTTTTTTKTPTTTTTTTTTTKTPTTTTTTTTTTKTPTTTTTIITTLTTSIPTAATARALTTAAAPTPTPATTKITTLIPTTTSTTISATTATAGMTTQTPLITTSGLNTSAPSTTTTTNIPLPPTTTTTPPLPTTSTITLTSTTTTQTTTPITTTTTTTTPTSTTIPPSTTITTIPSTIPTAATMMASTISLVTTTVNNRINKEVTHRQRGDVHIPRHPDHNQVWEFDIELGAVAGDAKDDPEVGVLCCTFEHGLCDWLSDREGDLHWETAHNPAGGQYLSVPELKAGQRSIRGARLAIQIVPPWSYQDLCFSFSHWLTGHHVGVLQLFVRKRERDQRYSPALWSRTGGHGWRHTQVTLTTHSVDKVLLKAERRKGQRGQMAIDDITLRSGPCR